MNAASRAFTSLARSCAAGISLFLISGSLAVASPLFTWDPSKSNPPLSEAGSAFTADTLLTTHYLHSVIQPGVSFAEELVLSVEQIQRGNQAVATPGLNSTPGAPGSYGLYFAIDATGQLTPGVTTFSTLDIALMGDPGNNNGMPTSSVSGISFANSEATGAADDVLLGTGTLVSGTMSFNPATGVRSAHFLESFQAVAGQSGFFVTPLDIASLLEEFLTTPASNFASVPGPDGTTIIIVNGGTGFANFVPESSSLMLVSGGLLILWLVRRRPSPAVRYASPMPA